ncbi:hypothetical protein CRG98_004090 [Punica granatum]|uniref:CDT1 Geminin-binding domain-containing protein n=1 Tax=Punica granatum TaxID=22663 RepID=A0A2I0L4E4_PUNGR|nr:hypothetical protein CRG98_004090 [Punica granatum]
MDQKQSEKSSGIPRSSRGSEIASQTPQKTNEPLLTEPKLPKRYKIISEFFDQMTCSLRLLSLCKKSPTFRNVSAQVQVLTKREFLYGHLAQIKYILPEALQTDKILVHDKKTLCVRPDVKITLLFDGIDVHLERSRVIALQELFASRLEDFVSSHPEACDVPEAMLPELFNQSSKVFSQTNYSLEDVGGDSIVQSQPTPEVGNLLEVPDTLQHVRKHFSEVIVPALEKTGLLVSQSPPPPSMRNQESESRGEICIDTVCADSDVVNGQAVNSGQNEVTPEGFPGFTGSTNSTQLTGTGPSVGYVACESPAVKEKCHDAEDHIFSQTRSGMCQQMASSLPGTVAVINDISLAVGCSSVTKEELLHKIIINNFDIVERREAEEQVELLEKLVPGWIYKKSTPSGDTTYRLGEFAAKRLQISILIGRACQWCQLIQLQHPSAALTAFSLLLRSGLRPDSFSVVGGLSACERSRYLLGGRGIHGMVLRSGFDSEPIVGNALVDMYSRNGEIGAAAVSALRVFDKMPVRNEVSWTAMILGCVRGERPIRALELFKEMKDDGVAGPTEITLVAVLSGCADNGALDLGLCIHGYISKIGMTENVAVTNALLDMYSKSGSLGSALSLFKEMQSRDVFSWTTMVSAYASHGKGSFALEMFYAILDSGVCPNEVTFLSVLSACSHAGMVLEGREIFRRMTEFYGLQPKIEH